jgi:DMSO/TMAO reductase YedYZ molybdopterin-dependent catalytic subunit
MDGAEPLVSENFYTVDIANVNPTVDESEWELTITGEVDEAVTLDYAALKDMESVDRFETLRCVGEDLNGKKMDTALWTGVPLQDLVARAGPNGDCECVRLRAADDYYQVFPMDALEDSLLAYGMNGNALPRGHGYPVRALIPGHWGEIQVKWITEIEVLDQDAEGYWEKKGWHGTGPVETVAKLHAINDLDDGRKEVGGHAYAGIRGIQRVEVSTDGGSTWNEAELTDPLEGIDAWRQWRYRYDPPDGSHEVVVRATDGEGTLQTEEERGKYPRGATGWVSKTVQ